MLPSYRPQEFLSLHAIEALARTVRALTAETGADLVVTTGDNTDNAQRNELDAYLALMDGGGTVDPGTGAPDAIPSAVSGGEYWNPEPSSRDIWKTDRAYPDHPGLLTEASRPFPTTGFGTPWLACFGNHDCLVQGRAPLTPEVQRLLTGPAKPTNPPPNPAPSTANPADSPVDPPRNLPADAGDRPVIDAYRDDPMLLSRGPGRAIPPRADRRIVDRAEYVRAHLDSAVGPPGHGFTEDNAAGGTAYYAYDPAPGVRFVVLDTTNPGGYADGSVGARQLAWLDERLREAPDRMVVIVSHHGLSTMTNDAPPPEPATTDLPRHLAADVAAVLHRHRNVVLWVSGHTHVNRVTPRPGASGGFWEVSTSSVAEWPVQARLVELGLDTDGHPAVRTTCVDSAAPAAPEQAEGLWRLAAIHREAAANEPGSVGGPEAHGTPTDRNVILLR
jgi:metallophosphoesterase (TIGR03767 family)